MNIPTDQQVLHVLTQEFIVDGQEDIREPIGMSGLRLEVRVHIVTGAVSAAQNIVKCVRRCGLEVQDLILQPLASSLAVLTADERNWAWCWSTSVAAPPTWRSSPAVRSATPPCCRSLATRSPTTSRPCCARPRPMPRKSLRYGVAKQVLASPDESVEVPGLGDRGPRQVKRQALGAVIEPRVEELFTLVQQVVRDSGYEDLLASGVVLTGGSAQLPGMVELAEDVFLKPVRVAVPEYEGSLADVMRNPRFSTVMGLLQEARMQRVRGKVAAQTGNFKSCWRA